MNLIFKNLNYLILIIAFNSCTLAGKNLGNLGFFSYLFRIKPKPVECLNYARTVNYTSSAGSNNSYKCNYRPDSISMECVYTNAITEDNISTITKTEYFNSTEDFILRTKNFAQSMVRYSQLNKDITTNKFFQYDPSGKLTGIIQSDGTFVTISEYDAKNRNTKGIVNPSNLNCQIPFTNSYDDINLSFKQSIFFSQLSPATNLLCNFFSTVVQDQTTELFFDKNFFLTKRVLTTGSTVTTEIFTTTESAQLCTGSDGAPYSAPIIQKFNSTGGAVGETVSIIGVNFDPDPGANTIQFSNGIKTFGFSATNSTLSFIVPAGATSGQITVTNRFGTALSKNTFYVYKYFVYTGNANSNSVTGFELNISDGSLINPTTLNIGNQPGNIIISPNGLFAFIINQGIIAVNSVGIATSNGALNAVTSANAGNGARSSTIAYSGNLLFVLNQTDNTISRFLIDSTNGGIVNLGVATPTGVTNPYSIAAHPSLPFLYVTGSSSSNVSAFTIDINTGSLSAISGSPFSISVNPLGITIHPNGLYLYTANNSVANSISRLSINQLTGGLTGEIFYSSVINESAAIDPLGNFIYACSVTNNQINSFQINQLNGNLNTIGSITSNQCRTVSVDPTGKYLFATEDVGGSAGKINIFTILSSGGLQSNGSISLGTNNPKGLVISRTPQ